MHLLIYLRRQYSSPLPPTALLRRLEHTVVPRPAGLLWWIGIRYLPCWGQVQPATNTFRARVRWGRSSGLVIQGRWQSAPATLPLAGTMVQLTIRLPLSEVVASCFLLCVATGACWLVSRPTHSLQSLVVVLSITSVFILFILLNAWGGIHRAERYFQQALLLSEYVE